MKLYFVSLCYRFFVYTYNHMLYIIFKIEEFILLSSISK